MLYPLSYETVRLSSLFRTSPCAIWRLPTGLLTPWVEHWWSRRDLNPQPSACKAGALPVELRPRFFWRSRRDLNPRCRIDSPVSWATRRRDLKPVSSARKKGTGGSAGIRTQDRLFSLFRFSRPLRSTTPARFLHSRSFPYYCQPTSGCSLHSRLLYGGPRRTRTFDLRSRKPPLYPLSYEAVTLCRSTLLSSSDTPRWIPGNGIGAGGGNRTRAFRVET